MSTYDVLMLLVLVAARASVLRDRWQVLHLFGERLHLRLGEVDLGAVAAAEDARRGEGHDAADQHDDEDDFDEAEAGLREAGGRGRRMLRHVMGHPMAFVKS